MPAARAAARSAWISACAVGSASPIGALAPAPISMPSRTRIAPTGTSPSRAARAARARARRIQCSSSYMAEFASDRPPASDRKLPVSERPSVPDLVSAADGPSLGVTSGVVCLRPAPDMPPAGARRASGPVRPPPNGARCPGTVECLQPARTIAGWRPPPADASGPSRLSESRGRLFPRPLPEAPLRALTPTRSWRAACPIRRRPRGTPPRSR